MNYKMRTVLLLAASVMVGIAMDCSYAQAKPGAGVVLGSETGVLTGVSDQELMRGMRVMPNGNIVVHGSVLYGSGSWPGELFEMTRGGGCGAWIEAIPFGGRVLQMDDGLTKLQRAEREIQSFERHYRNTEGLGPYYMVSDKVRAEVKAAIADLEDEKSNAAAQAKLVKFGTQAYPELYIASKSKSQSLAFAANVVIEKINAEQLKFIPDIIKKFGDKDYRVRQVASKQILVYGEIAKPLLEKAMKSGDLEVAQRAQEAIIDMGHYKYKINRAMVIWKNAGLIGDMRQAAYLRGKKLSNKRKEIDKRYKEVQRLRYSRKSNRNHIVKLKEELAKARASKTLTEAERKKYVKSLEEAIATFRADIKASGKVNGFELEKEYKRLDKEVRKISSSKRLMDMVGDDLRHMK